MWPLPVSWTQSPKSHPLPVFITRSFIQSPNGPLELLSTVPASSLCVAPILFIHGGFGSASVWLPWLSYLAACGQSAYAVSLRGHGMSWTPGFSQMWALTTKSILATDVVAAVQELERRHEGKRVILAGHSSGGGLAQLVLSDPKYEVKAAGLALVATIPPFGSLGVYANWFRLDPGFVVRSLMHLQHPRSPLSSSSLVKAAFFGERMAMQDVKEFETWMPEYESLVWPIGMMWKFVDTVRVTSALVGWGHGRGDTRVLIIAGGEDKLMSLDIMQRVAEEYRLAVRDMEGRKKIEEIRQRVSDSNMDKGVVEAVEQSKDGVTLAVVEGAGHHLQNDIQRDRGAEIFRKWVEGF